MGTDFFVAVLIVGVISACVGVWILFARHSANAQLLQSARGSRSGAGSGLSLQESLKKKKDMSYYYAHSRGNKASDVDIEKIGKRGGYGIGAPPLISKTSASGSSPFSAPSAEGGGAGAGAPPPRSSRLPADAGAYPLRNYSWEDSGKLIKLYVDFPTGSATGADLGTAETWSHSVQLEPVPSASTTLVLVLLSSGGTKYALRVGPLFAPVEAVRATTTKSGKRCVVRLTKQKVSI